MELGKSGGIAMFIIMRIMDRTAEGKWIGKKWVEKKTLEDIFDKLAKKRIEIYTHFEFGNPWETFDEDLALFEDIGWIEIESRIDQTEPDGENGKMTLKEKVYVRLTKTGRSWVDGKKLAIAEHQKLIEEIIDDIVIGKG